MVNLPHNTNHFVVKQADNHNKNVHNYHTSVPSIDVPRSLGGAPGRFSKITKGGMYNVG